MIELGKNMKMCRGCDEILHVRNFYRRGDLPHLYRHPCKKCMARRERERYHARKAAEAEEGS